MDYAGAYASAMTSHSTSTSLGRRATSTQLLAGNGSVLLHSGADAYIVVSVGSFVTGVVFTLLGIRYRQYKALHRPFSPDAADKASSQSLSDDQ